MSAMKKEKCEYVVSFFRKLLIPDGVLIVFLISFFCAKYGAYYGVKLANIAEAQMEHQTEMKRYKSNTQALLNETSNNITNLRDMQTQLRWNAYHITPLTTYAADHFLLQPESYQYPDNTFLYHLREMKDAIYNYNNTSEFMLRQFQENRRLSNENILAMRKSAINLEARIIMVQDMIDEQTKKYGMKEDNDAVKKRLKADKKKYEHIEEGLGRKYGVGI